MSFSPRTFLFAILPALAALAQEPHQPSASAAPTENRASKIENPAAGNLVFGGSREGWFFALDATTGRPLWRFPTGGSIMANPISFLVEGLEHIAICAASAVFVFSL